MATIANSERDVKLSRRSHPDELPPAVAHVYPQVTIDLGRCIVADRDGHEAPLEGKSYALLAHLLAHPGRFFTYWQLARALMPEFIGRPSASQRYWSWSDLTLRDQAAIKHALHCLVHRARRTLGEPSDGPSILVNRRDIGYAIQRPLSTRNEHDL